LGTIVVSTHHIGSTAVPGLRAKPIIDILLEVSSLPELDERADRLEKLGYEAMGEFGIPGRRYFRKGRSARTHHIHAFKRGDTHIRRHLAFRDYLIAHAEIAAQYGRLKAGLAAEFANDNEGYCAGKDGFVKFYEAEALNWIVGS
jgi:GrpB-like predicted nucleotidyltransferase (UPF0157 family)